MKIDFRVDWGYQYLYSRRHYHPVYIWDGEIICDKGSINEVYKLEYPYVWFGIPNTPIETKQESNKWESRTKRGFAGIHVIADVEEDAIITVKTASKTITFAVKDLLENGRIVYKVGPKYLNCNIIVTKTGYLWFKAKPKKGEIIFSADMLSLPVHNCERTDMAWLAPGKRAKWEADVKDTGKDYTETLFHSIAMAAPEYKEGLIIRERKIMKLALYCDGKKLIEYERLYKNHDYIQILEDDWKRVHIEPGHHVFELENMDDELYLAISSISMTQCGYMHGELSIPEWGLKNENLVGRVFAAREDNIKVSQGNDEMTISCKKGWNEFDINFAKSGKYIYKTDFHDVHIEIYDVDVEEDPVKVGYGTTFIPLDDRGFMEWMLDYTARTRLGNYVNIIGLLEMPCPKEVTKRMGEFCKKHGIYLSAANNYMDGGFSEGAGEMFHDCGPHELPGKVYAFDPTEPYVSSTMKEAAEKYVDYLKVELDNARKVCKKAAYGDASGGIRYSYLAGADFVRVETMVSHTQTLLSQARAATEALGDGKWAVHIASQHTYFPYFNQHLGQYFLSIMQPWTMGAEAIYEEDSLNCLFKEERQCWDDAMVKGKRDMTRSFFKFAKTHPRKGKNIRNIAFLEGRYAAPFNGMICGTEQDPHYAVWGMFGNDAKEWGHTQPEKCRQLLDVLMPGASTLPMRQKFDKRRFLFSGTPYGDFDCIPVEAKSDFYKNYKLMMNLGWNTMIQEDYDKLKSYVENGGVLLTGIPQFSTHIKREFLKDMNDLSLWNNGDLSELCGIKIKEKGTEFSGQWNCNNKEIMPEPELSAMPNDFSEEDGKGYSAEFENVSAEVIAWDMSGGEPLLVKNKVGKGYVYTFTIWAYPGHEKFQEFCASWISYLCENARSDIYVTDDTDEIFWTVWENKNEKVIYILNTDWTVKDNIKNAYINTPCENIKVEVKEGTLTTVTVRENKIINTESYSLN